MSSQHQSDHWTSESYKNAAGFVPKLTTTVVIYLDAQPGDHILDIGCGDGILTSQVAAALSGSGKIHGLDASPSFIATAQSEHQPRNCSYELQDCTALDGCASINGQWDKVFSNAALHWILRKEETRLLVFENVFKALKPGGMFVFEMGGKGNVAEIHAAFTSALMQQGLSLAQAREASPWFFPSTAWMSEALSNAGFHVEICEIEYRPTKMLSASKDNAQGTGLRGWLRLMGAQFLEAVDTSKQENVLQHVEDVLADVVTREEDGSQWIGYVRLRAVARKP